MLCKLRKLTQKFELRFDAFGVCIEFGFATLTTYLKSGLMLKTFEIKRRSSWTLILYTFQLRTNSKNIFKIQVIQSKSRGYVISKYAQTDKMDSREI